MKTSFLLIITFFLFNTCLFSQEPVEKVVVVEGCEQLQENSKLKDCMSKVATKTLQDKKFIIALAKTLNPGQNKFYITFNVTQEKKIELDLVNTTNSKTQKLIQKQLKKIKILEPGMQKGEPVKVKYKLPLIINNGASSPIPVHKMSRLVFLYDKSNTSKLKPIFRHCGKQNKKKYNTKCMNTYLVDGTFNSVDAKEINPMLKDGLNTIKIKIIHDENDEILKINPSSGSVKLDVIFKKTIESLLNKTKFISPFDEEASYSGEMVLILNYFKK